MLFSRTSNLFSILLAACVVFSCALAEGTGGLLRSATDVFLSELQVGEAVREKLLESVDTRSNSKEYTAIARSEDGGVFCLALVQILSDQDADVAAELEVFSQNRALFLARGRLAIALGQSKVKQELYHYDEALGSALFAYYGPRGIQTAAEVLKQTGSRRFAAALAWLSADLANALQNEVPPQRVLDEDYCRFLYLNHAKELFRTGRYSEALPLFKDIHDLRWMDISAYLDAAECFLKMKEPGECLTLVKEIRSALDKDMSSEELSRAGRLCRKAGDRKAALEAFNQARARFHEEITCPTSRPWTP